jgi:DNA-binding transcriptional MerR regulator
MKAKRARKTKRVQEISEVAQRLGRSAASVRDYADAGRLVPCAVTTRGVRLFDPHDVARFARELAAKEGAA